MSHLQHLKQRNDRSGQRAVLSTGSRLAAAPAPSPSPAPATATLSRTALASALVCERRRVALRHRRHPTDETQVALAAIDLALAEYRIDIPALEQARSARQSRRTGAD